MKHQSNNMNVLMEFIRRNVMNWYEKGIKIKDREYAEEMLRQIGYFPLMGGYKHLFRISNTKKYKAGTSFEEIVSLYKFDAELRELFFKYLLQIERCLLYTSDAADE